MVQNSNIVVLIDNITINSSSTYNYLYIYYANNSAKKRKEKKSTGRDFWAGAVRHSKNTHQFSKLL